eukprot:354861-Chlamydomonas_euryale.AAC.6
MPPSRKRTECWLREKAISAGQPHLLERVHTWRVRKEAGLAVLLVAQVPRWALCDVKVEVPVLHACDAGQYQHGQLVGGAKARHGGKATDMKAPSTSDWQKGMFTLAAPGCCSALGQRRTARASPSTP